MRWREELKAAVDQAELDQSRLTEQVFITNTLFMVYKGQVGGYTQTMVSINEAAVRTQQTGIIGRLTTSEVIIN